MRSTAFAALVAAAAGLGGCAHDVRARLPGAAPGAETGTITIVLTKAASDLTVAIDGRLVIERAHTRKAVIEAPPGFYTVVIAADAVERSVDLTVEAGRDVAIPMGSPGAGGPGHGVILGAITSVAYLAARILYDIFR